MEKAEQTQRRHDLDREAIADFLLRMGLAAAATAFTLGVSGHPMIACVVEEGHYDTSRSAICFIDHRWPGPKTILVATVAWKGDLTAARAAAETSGAVPDRRVFSLLVAPECRIPDHLYSLIGPGAVVAFPDRLAAGPEMGAAYLLKAGRR